MNNTTNTIRLTMAEALVKFLCNQYIETEGNTTPLFVGVFAIFGHGNVTCLAHALEKVQNELPTWRGQNEQSMAHAAIAYTKAKKRQQIMVVSSSIGPGATNMITAAGVAHTNRLPLLILAGDYFASRRPHPVLQQVENFDDPTQSVNDAFKPVTRYWDRITHPEQIIESLPQAIQTMLDPSDCGPAFIGLCQDTQEIAFDYPNELFQKKVHRWKRPRGDSQDIEIASTRLKKAKKPLIIAGGGVHYSLAEQKLADFAEKFGIPVVETVAGRSNLLDNHPCFSGPIGVTGSDCANKLSQEADVILALGTRLQDFTTGSWSNFQKTAQFIGLNTARFDAFKHQSIPVISDVLEGLDALEQSLSNYKAPVDWLNLSQQELKKWHNSIDNYNSQQGDYLHYGQIIQALNQTCNKDDYVLTAAGGLPGELNKVWRTKAVGTFDCEYGFSCMGYEVAGGWGAKMAKEMNDVYVLVGDGSYLMHNSDVYSSILTGHKLNIIICDNKGYAVINRLQQGKGGKPFNNQIADSRVKNLCYVDFAKHAESMGALSKTVTNKEELIKALTWIKGTDRTSVIFVEIDPFRWSPGGCWWDVGVPEISDDKVINQAREEHIIGRQSQRIGV